MALAHQVWQDARASVLGAWQAGSRCIAVVGQSGTGKTLMMSDIARSLASIGKTGVRRASESADHPAMLVTVGDDVTSLIDNADRLSDTALAAMAALGGIRYVFAGSTDLADRLRRIVPDTHIVTLAALSPEQARIYLALWLEREELSPKRFDPAAEADLIAAAGGIPRVLSRLAWRASDLAASEGRRRVMSRHVREVAPGIPGTRPLPPASAATRGTTPVARLATAAGLVMVTCLGVLAQPATSLSRAVDSVASTAREARAMLHVAATFAIAKIAPLRGTESAARNVPTEHPPAP